MWLRGFKRNLKSPKATSIGSQGFPVQALSSARSTLRFHLKFYFTFFSLKKHPFGRRWNLAVARASDSGCVPWVRTHCLQWTLLWPLGRLLVSGIHTGVVTFLGNNFFDIFSLPFWIKNAGESCYFWTFPPALGLFWPPFLSIFLKSQYTPWIIFIQM